MKGKNVINAWWYIVQCFILKISFTHIIEIVSIMIEETSNRTWQNVFKITYEDQGVLTNIFVCSCDNIN
jgi:predicted CDP-diglyceride synthetase/phosphatidate cytidylyltransferase